MVIKGVEIHPGMILTDDKDSKFVAIPHKRHGVVFMAYDKACSWSEHLSSIAGEIVEIRDAPEGPSLVDGKLLWKKARYRINGGIELSEEQFLKEIRTRSGKIQVEVI